MSKRILKNVPVPLISTSLTISIGIVSFLLVPINYIAVKLLPPVIAGAIIYFGSFIAIGSFIFIALYVFDNI